MREPGEDGRDGERAAIQPVRLGRHCKPQHQLREPCTLYQRLLVASSQATCEACDTMIIASAQRGAESVSSDVGRWRNSIVELNHRSGLCMGLSCDFLGGDPCVAWKCATSVSSLIARPCVSRGVRIPLPLVSALCHGRCEQALFMEDETFHCRADQITNAPNNLYLFESNRISYPKCQPSR